MKTSTHCDSVIRDFPGLESLDPRPQTADVPPKKELSGLLFHNVKVMYLILTTIFLPPYI